MPGIFAPSTLLNTDDNNASTSFRSICSLTGGSNGQIRVTWLASSTVSLSTSHCSLGIWTGSGNNGNTILTPVELLFNNGVSGFIGLGVGQTITSDFVNFNCGSSDKLVIITDVGAPGGNRFSTGNSNIDTWFKSGATSFDQAAPTGFTLLSGIDYMISAIETNAPAVNALQGYQPLMVM